MRYLYHLAHVCHQLITHQLTTTAFLFDWQYLEKELGIESLRTMKRIKAALDPNNIMNPGKLIPPHVCI
jgi:hypothetical protein